MKKILFRTIVLLIASLLVSAALLVGFGICDQLGKSDIGLVLGNTVDAKGNPSARLQARLDRAVELYNDGFFKTIIVSGGTGKEGFPEGTAMQIYLVSRGIPKNSIVVDNDGVDTQATALNTKRILTDLGQHSVLVISQYFHVPRCRLALAKAGLDEVYSAHARFFEWRDFYSIARELPAFVKYSVLPKSPAVPEKRGSS